MRRDTGTGRNIAMLLGGIGAGIVGGRLLPPIIATMVGSRRAQAGGDPFARLTQDHRQILSTLDEMVTAPAGSRLRRSRLFLALKRKLAKHALAEEDVVYPNVCDESAEGNQRKHLYDEHADMKVLLYAIENQLMAGEEWNSAVIPLRELIRRHMDEEERVIFPELRRALTENKLPAISGQISREEALIV